MAKTVTISDDLASLVEERAKKEGYPSIDAAAEALISHGLIANDLDEDHSAGFSNEELRALIQQADESGEVVPWDAAAVRREVLRRYASRKD